MARSTAGPGSFVRGLHPNTFAMVMATGIVSVASDLMGLPLLARGLFWLNIVLYLGLWAVTLARMFYYPSAILDDLASHIRGVGFFTTIAATCILGTQFALLEQAYAAATALLGLGLVLWLGLVYGVLAMLITRTGKPSLEQGLGGGWLLAVVSTQAVSILSAILAPHHPSLSAEMLFFALSMFMVGGMLYLMVIPLIFYRLLFLSMEPVELGPPYWINAGAVAITTLAGTTLLSAGRDTPIVAPVSHFVQGLTLFFWAASSWWIPLLFVLGAWRHLIRRFPLTYDHAYWSLVFPLGMYTACTFRLADVAGLDFIRDIPRLFIHLALIAWALTFLGFLKSLTRRLSSKP